MLLDIKERTYQYLVTEAIQNEMARDENVFLMGFEVSHYKPNLLEEFGPHRVIDMPIAELAVTGLAVGAARVGKKPIVDLIGTSFFFLAMDQIANNAAATKDLFADQLTSSLVIRGLTGIGEIPGGVHHCRMPHSIFMQIPGLRVVYPSCAEDAKGLMTASIRDPGPVLFMEHLRLYKSVATREIPSFIPLGQAVTRIHGEDVTIVAIGPMVKEALTAAEYLFNEGISAEVIDPRSLVPMDYETIVNSTKRTGTLVVVDEAHETCSAASQIISVISEKLPYVNVRKLTVPDINIPFSAARAWDKFSPTAPQIIEAVRNLVKDK